MADIPAAPEVAGEGTDERILQTPNGTTYARGGKVFLRKSGEDFVRQFDEADVEGALQSRQYHTVSPSEVYEIDNKRKIREFGQAEGALGTVKAVGQSAARAVVDTATLLPRLAGVEAPTGGEVLERLGADPEAQRLRTLANPIGAAAGAFAPEAAAAFYTGGLAAGAKAGGSTLLRAVARSAAVNAGATAGAAGHRVTERAWMTQTPVDLARLRAKVSVGALLGGALGGAGGALGAGLGKGATGIQNALSNLPVSSGLLAGKAVNVAGAMFLPRGMAAGAGAKAAVRGVWDMGKRAVVRGANQAGKAGHSPSQLGNVFGKGARVGAKGIARGATLGGRHGFSAEDYNEEVAYSHGQLELAKAQELGLQNIQHAVLKASGDKGPWNSVSGVGDYANFPGGQFRYPGETRRQAFFARTKNLAELAASPELLIDQLSQQSEALGYFAPEVSRDMINTSIKAVKFLETFGRASMAIPDPLQPHLTEGVVDEGSMTSYERLWNATMFPATVLDELAQYDIHEETIVALQNVHPDYLQDVRQHVSLRMTEGKWRPTYQQRLQLSVLLGGVEPTATPQFQARYASYPAMAGQAGAQQGAAPPPQKPGRPKGNPTMNQQFKPLSQSIQIGTER